MNFQAFLKESVMRRAGPTLREGFRILFFELNLAGDTGSHITGVSCMQFC